MSDTTTERWDALIEVGRRFLTKQQLDKAEEAYAAALRLAESFGDDDPRLATTLNALARVYCRRDKFFPAAALLHRLLGIKERTLGRAHPELGGIVSNLAEMYARLGDAAQELALRERALEIRARRGDADHVALAGAYERIAHLRRRLADAARPAARPPTRDAAPPPLAPAPFGAQGVPLAPAPFGARITPVSRPSHAGVPSFRAPRSTTGRVVPLTVAQVTAAAPRRSQPAPAAPRAPLAPPAPDVSPELRRHRQVPAPRPAPRRATTRVRVPRLANWTRLVATVAAAAALVVFVAAKREPRPAVAASKPVYSVAAEGTVAASGVGLSNDAVIQAGLASLGLARRDSAPPAPAAQSEPEAERFSAPVSSQAQAAASTEADMPTPHTQPHAARPEPKSATKWPTVFPDVNAVTRSIEQTARRRVDSMNRAGGVKNPTFARPRVPAKPEF